MSCSQLIEIEDLVLGTIEPARARELHAHVEACTACRREQAAVTKERALFTHREETFAAPPASIAVALRAELTLEVADPSAARARSSISGSRLGPARRGATRFVRRGASVLGQVLRRGHVSAACAAVLFALVAFSKLGGAPILPTASSESATSEPSSGATASLSQSFADDGLSCTLGGSMSTFSSDRLFSSGATTQFSSFGSPAREVVLACGRGEGSRASCESSGLCSSLRQ